MHILFTFGLAIAAALFVTDAGAHGVIGAPGVPGLIVRGSRGDADVQSARRFAEVLHARFALTLILWSELRGVQTPAFSGLVVDADRQVVANFKLITVDRVEDVHAGLKRAVDRARRFTDVAAWDQLRVRTGGRWRARSPAGFDYLKTLFTVPGGRPTWVLIDVDDARAFSAPRELAIRKLTRDSDPVALTLIRRDGVLITIANGRAHAERTPRCQSDLI